MNRQLLKAAWRGDVDACNALIAAGASVNAADCRGLTALMYASARGSVNVCSALLAAGASVDAVDSAGRTALMLASQQGYVDVCSALLAAGENMEAVYSGRVRLASVFESLVTGGRRRLRALPPLAVAVVE